MPKFKIKTASCINLCTEATGIVGVKGLMICWAETLHAKGSCCDSDYTLSPNTDYNGMAKQIAAVIQWTKDSISKHKGNQTKFYHRTFRGHLGALAVMNPKYGIDPKVFLESS
jgi:hypothetical protein